MDVGFPNDIGLDLAGRLEWPARGPQVPPVVVFAHGFDSGKDSPRGRLVAEGIREAGMATFLIDFAGHGESQGTKHDSTIERQTRDLGAALDFVTHSGGIDSSRIGLCGASSGGLVALLVALKDERVKAVALRGPRTDGMAARAHGFTVPVLMIQGSLDPLLPETENFRNSLPAGINKKLEVIPGGDHLFSGSGQIEAVRDITAGWFWAIFGGVREAVA